jgi:hypothetical protein
MGFVTGLTQHESLIFHRQAMVGGDADALGLRCQFLQWPANPFDIHGSDSYDLMPFRFSLTGGVSMIGCFLSSAVLTPSWPKPMVSAVIPAKPPSCMDSTAVLGTMTMVEFSFKPSYSMFIARK